LNFPSIVLACALLFPAGVRAALTYSFEWFCSGCAAVGMGSNGREGPFGSGSACEGARASMSGSLDARGCGPGCFNPQPCISSGRPDAPASPVVIPPPVAAPAYSPPLYDARAERARRADEVGHEKEEGAPRALDVSGGWHSRFSRYQARSSKDAIEIVLTETCRTPDCARRDTPNRTVFRGRLEGRRLVGVLPIRGALESDRGGGRCAAPGGEFGIEGTLSDDGKTIVWGRAQLPVPQGCAPASISLGTWRRG
jgi:hypothetical protein